MKQEIPKSLAFMKYEQAAKPQAPGFRPSSSRMLKINLT